MSPPMPKFAANVTHLADAGRARVEIDDRVLVLGLEQIGPRLRHVLHELGVDDERDGQRVDREPLAVGIAEHRRQLVEVDRLERRDHALADGVDRRGREIVRGVRLRAVARLVERDDRRRRADVVVDDLDFGIALLERGELRRPVGPGRARCRSSRPCLPSSRLRRAPSRPVELGRIERRSARATPAAQQRQRRCQRLDESAMRLRHRVPPSDGACRNWMASRGTRTCATCIARIAVSISSRAVARRRPRPAGSRRKSGRARPARRTRSRRLPRPRRLDPLGAHEEAHARRPAARPCGGVARRPSGVSTASGAERPAVDQIGAADEVGDEGIGRRVVDLVRRRRLHEAALAHHDHAIGERQRFVLVVRDEQRGDVLLALDAPDLVAHRRSASRRRAPTAARRAAARAA